MVRVSDAVVRSLQGGLGQSRSGDEILAEMKRNWRDNIRLASRKSKSHKPDASNFSRGVAPGLFPID